MVIFWLKPETVHEMQKSGGKFLQHVSQKLGTRKYFVIVLTAVDRDSCVEIFHKGKLLNSTKEEVFDAMMLHLETNHF